MCGLWIAQLIARQSAELEPSWLRNFLLIDMPLFSCFSRAMETWISASRPCRDRCSSARKCPWLKWSHVTHSFSVEFALVVLHVSCLLGMTTRCVSKIYRSESGTWATEEDLRSKFGLSEDRIKAVRRFCMKHNLWKFDRYQVRHYIICWHVCDMYFLTVQQ